MVISGVNTVTYNGDGVTTAWPYTFPVTDDSEIRVQLNNADGTAVIIESDYYVDLVNSTVYYPGYAPGAEPPEADQPPKVQEGQTITVYREIPITQEADLGEKWPFEVIEKGLDKLTMIAQQIDSGTKRTLDNALASMEMLADVVVDSGELQHITEQLNAIDDNAAAAKDSADDAADSADDAEASAALAKKWANYTDGVVADSEYSAKYYANNASSSATSASNSATDAQNLYNALIAQGGHPFQAATVADMTDTTKIYVYTGSETGYVNGNWYYYDGAAWVSGGVYNAVAVQTDTTLTQAGEPADAKVTGDALQNIIPSENQLKPQLYDNANPTIINGFLGNVSGQQKFSASPAAKCLCFLVKPNTKYTLAIKKASVIGGRRTLGFFTSIPTDQTYGEIPSVTTEVVGDWTYNKMTTSATTQYIVMYYYNANDGVAEATIRQEIMLTEGWTIYPYLYYGQVAKLLVFKDNLNENGTAGQTLMVDEDGTSLIWGTPAVSVELDDTLTQSGKAADSKATGDAIASTKTELETEIGQVVLTDGVQEWLDDHPEAMIVIKRNGDADDTPILDSELLSSSGWTSTGWTGDFTNGFTHTTGNTNPLTLTIPTLVEGGLYQFQITTSNAATNGWSDFYVSLGGSPTFETYKGGGASVSYTYGLICGSTKVLTITPRNDYTGTVTGLSLKKVTNTVGTQYELYDTNGNTTFEFRTVKNTQAALYMGVNSGSKSFYGYENVAVGDRALRDNTGGFWNTAVGRRALESNQMGSRNVAIGYIALLHNTGGDRNVAIGTFALESNTTGRGNTAINADALQDNTTGSYNTAIGVGAGSGVGGSNNIAIGNRALASNTAGGGNIALGRYTMEKATAGSNNIAIGNQCCDESGITGSNNIAIGYNVALPNTAGSNQIVIGTSSHTSVVIAGKELTFNNDGTITWTSV